MKRVALLMIGLIAGSPADAGEVWVVGSAGKSVKVVDTVSESVIATIPLAQGSQAPPPRGIAFSTVDGLAGAFAFVGQGSTIQVLDAGEKALTKSVDLDPALGIDVTIVDLESSPNRAFVDADGNPEVRAYLVVVGDAVRQTGGLPEPYWVVLDQRALVFSPPPVPLVAGSGFLHEPNSVEADRGRAAGVSVMGAPRGAAFLRSWVTTRVAGAVDTMRATLLETEIGFDAPWIVGSSKERVLPPGSTAPENFAVAATHDGAAQIFPGGATGTLVDLGHNGSCELPANVGAVAIRGPGAGGYEIVAVDLDTEALLRVNESTCDFKRTPVGSGPADVTVDALFEHGAAWVANRESDNLTVVRLDGSSGQVPLGAPPSGGCVECPVSVEARIGAGRACTPSLRLSKTATGVGLSWDTVGCTGATYSLFCQCDRRFDLDCTCTCDPLTTPGCFGSLPLSWQPGVESGTLGEFGPLTRQLQPVGGSPEPLPTPPEPVIQLGQSAGPMVGNDGGGGGLWIGTKPP